MDEFPLISIVIPSFNQACYLKETLDSIFRQNYPKLEVVVMDGGSEDGSVEIIQAYEDRLSFWQSKPDDGQSAAINEGIEHCNGEIIAWLNSDDYYWEDSLWTVACAYLSHPGYGLYIGNGFRYKQKYDQYLPFSKCHVVLNRKALIEGVDYILQPSTFFLRSAWEEVNGLNTTLHYCMDWDIIIRIAAKYSAVVINEFLAVSREYENTKTSKGNLKRVFEICSMIHKYSQREMTIGSMYYIFAAFEDMANSDVSSKLGDLFSTGMDITRELLTQEFGSRDGFPTEGDPQDKVYLPIPSKRDPLSYYCTKTKVTPSISIITPSYNQAQFLPQTLDSILDQHYPNIETIVFDGGSTDGSVDILKQYDDRLSHWVSEKDRGPAHAINKGFSIAKGEIIGWLNSDDMLACGTLWEVGKLFAENPDLDMVFANALYIDENNKLYLADYGNYKTGLYYGEMQPLGCVPAYWSYIHAVPQPTVFFRRRLLDSCGHLDESYHFIFDFELFFRFMWKAKIKKIEHTLAFYRIHSAAKTSSWNNFLIELYRYSRPWWPKLSSPQFRITLRDFVSSYLLRKYGPCQHNLRFWFSAALVSLSAVTRIGNPEAMRLPLDLKATDCTPSNLTNNINAIKLTKIDDQSKFTVDRSNIRYKSIFCSFLWPRHPGHSGGEIRDFHLIRQLLSSSKVDFFALHDVPVDGRTDHLAPFLDSLQSPELISKKYPELLDLGALQTTFRDRFFETLRSNGFPVPGVRYHHDVASRLPIVTAYSIKALQTVLESKKPDFLFISPQSNPVALKSSLENIGTRLIMASYDVEAVRMQRLAGSHHSYKRILETIEARRAKRFEQDNLALYDGIIAVSELDKDIFIRDYLFEEERVLVIENSIDPEYFSYTERQSTDKQHIVFVGSLGYLPNHQAALRLIRNIMPLVRLQYPEAYVWIVGQGPDQELIAQADNKHTIVTGKVDDVRPYLAMASLVCVPLVAGSGTKYKILEAMSAGVPVVCSPLASEGLDLEQNKHFLSGQTDAELSDAIVQLLNNPASAIKLAEEARSNVVNKYSWNANLKRLDGWMSSLLSLPKRNYSNNQKQ